MNKITNYFHSSTTNSPSTEPPPTEPQQQSIPPTLLPPLSSSLSPTILRDRNFELQLYPHFLDTTTSHQLFEYLQANVPFYKSSSTAASASASASTNKRYKALYGTISTYNITYRGKDIATKVTDWNTLPILRDMAQYISTHITHQPIHTASLHYYPTGQADIKPHRDKEMKRGTIIASLSFGATRNMQFIRASEYRRMIPPSTHNVPLSAGTLCLIMSPTNEFWLHSIPKDPSCIEPRMSIVFRNCEGMT